MTTDTGESQDNEGLEHFLEKCLIDEEIDLIIICCFIILTPFISSIIYILTSNSS